MNMRLAHLGEIGCRLDGSMVYALTLVAIFSLSNIRVMYILLICIWVTEISVAISLVYFRRYYQRQWKNYLETYCTEDTVLIYPYWHSYLDHYKSQALSNKYSIMVNYKGKLAQILSCIVVAFIICSAPFPALVIRRAQLLKETPKTAQAETMYRLCSSLRKESFLYPAIPWLIRRKKPKQSELCSVSLPKPEIGHNLRPRSS